MPDMTISIWTAAAGFFLSFLAYFLKKWIPYLYVHILTAILGSGWIVYVFLNQDFVKTMTIFFIFVFSFFSSPVPARSKTQWKKISDELKEQGAREIALSKKKERLFVDFLFSGFFILIAVLYFLFGPDSPIALILLYSFISLVVGLTKRVGVFRSLRLFYREQEEVLYAVSLFETKKYPLKELSEVSVQTRPDVLQLFELFSLFSPNVDYTTSMGKTWKLSFSGEKVYLTPDPSESMAFLHQGEIKKMEEVEVKPFYHQKNWKRLLGKWYFAAAVKGVGIYAVLITLLALLRIGPIITTAITIVFWIFNLSISDRVLKIALDMKKIDDPDLLPIIENVFSRAGLSHVEIYVTESTEYNGFAIGANIGRSLVALTSETLKLPHEAIKGILAHEAIHVKKRDVLIGQLLRFLLIGLILASVFFFNKYVHDENGKTFAFLGLWLLLFLFPAFQSLFTQWMEVRADHLGATLLDGGNAQMANSLAILCEYQDRALEKSAGYRVTFEKEQEVNQKNKKISSLERDSWFFRFLEFQFMSHPPMYWRVHSLQTTETGWSIGKIKLWLCSRFRESLPH
ncbi:M56 family metallopeptidase [Geobacillus sp. FSL W8-0032]|uniref:Protease HtpX n=1 Tax=Geobacillus icigianus TaxID=1430331 RepID=A0ABU6BJK8_9BACL|nr:M56 family metallopeptidase [Geobacillus icigianus]MEB3751980.1 Protease HtpX [Geobacillus icigianus]